VSHIKKYILKNSIKIAYIKNIEKRWDISERKYPMHIQHISMIYIGDIYQANLYGPVTGQLADTPT